MQKRMVLCNKGKQIMERIKHFIPRNDGNGATTRRVLVDEIEFCSLPYQPYYALFGKKFSLLNSTLVKGKKTQTDGFEVEKKWSVSISEARDDGSSTVIEGKIFDDQDSAFLWAVEKIKEGQV